MRCTMVSAGVPPAYIIDADQQKDLRRFPFQNRIQAIIHSHADIPADPSVLDMLITKQLGPLRSVRDTVSQKNNILRGDG